MDTFTYGTKKLKVLNQQNNFVPKTAQEIDLAPDDRKALAGAVEDNTPALLMGETGTGKTSVIRYIAFKRKQGYSRINANGYSTPDEWIGSKSVKDGATYYENGTLTKAMQEGHILVLDEINAAPPECSFVIHGLLDDDKRITMPNGDIIEPHPDFRFFATMNPDYEGTKSLNRALIDRFNTVIQVDTLSPKKEAELLVERGKVDSANAESMVTVGTMARKSYHDQKTLTYVSTRSLLQWARLIAQGLSNKQAFTMAIANKTRQTERAAFLDMFNAVFKMDSAQDDSAVPIVTTKGEVRIKDERIDFLEKLYQQTLNQNAELTAKIDESKDMQEKAEQIKQQTEEYEKLKEKYQVLNDRLRIIKHYIQ